MDLLINIFIEPSKDHSLQKISICGGVRVFVNLYGITMKSKLLIPYLSYQFYIITLNCTVVFDGQ